eukprot:gene14127-biopygen11293
MSMSMNATEAKSAWIDLKEAYFKHPPRKDYPDLSKHNNIMADYLTPNLYNKLRDKRTKSGFTLDKAIQTGVDNPNHKNTRTVGLVAGDEESYKLFGELFDPVIKDRHSGYKKTDQHKTDLNASKINDGFLDEKYVISCRCRAARSIRGLALPPHCTRAERREVERIVTSSLASLKGEIKGSYYPLNRASTNDQNEIIRDNILRDKSTSPLAISAGMSRDWPDARGIWHDDKKTLFVSVNVQDHARIISMQKGGNMKQVFERFCNGVKQVETSIMQDGEGFMWNKHLGYIATCPSNLGTGLRAGVHMKLPLMSKHEKFDGILRHLRLQKRDADGMNATPADGDGVCDISNHDRLGYSEVQLVQKVIDGVKKLIEMEKRLKSGKEIKDLLPKHLKED